MTLNNFDGLRRGQVNEDVTHTCKMWQGVVSSSQGGAIYVQPDVAANFSHSSFVGNEAVRLHLQIPSTTKMHNCLVKLYVNDPSAMLVVWLVVYAPGTPMCLRVGFIRL